MGIRCCKVYHLVAPPLSDFLPLNQNLPVLGRGGFNGWE